MLVTFSASWCPPYRSEIRGFAHYIDKHCARGVVSDFDGVFSIPATKIFDKIGKLVFRVGRDRGGQGWQHLKRRQLEWLKTNFRSWDRLPVMLLQIVQHGPDAVNVVVHVVAAVPHGLGAIGIAEVILLVEPLAPGKAR